MKQGLKAKFEQNSVLKGKLLGTGGSEIIERSTDDMYWSQLASGTGYNMKYILYIDNNVINIVMENCKIFENSS